MTEPSIEDVDAFFAAKDAEGAVATATAPSVSEEAAARDEAMSQLAGNMPLMQPVDGNVTLIRGFLTPGGNWEQDAFVRGLTGIDEEAIYGAKTPYDRFNAVLERGVVRLGSFQLDQLQPSERRGIVSNLLVPERHQLYLAIVKATFGPKREFDIRCVSPDCGAQIHFDLDLDQFSIEPMENPHVGTYHLMINGHDLAFRLNTGADEAEIMSKASAQNVAEQRSKLIELCVQTLDGAPIGDKAGFARSLGLADRQRLLEVINRSQPKYDLEIEMGCPTCGYTNRFVLAWDDFFRI